MSVILPPVDHPSREHFSVADVAAIFAPGGRRTLPLLAEARRNAVNFMAREPAAKAVTSFVLRGDDRVQLVQFGPKGGRKTLWTFQERH